jgi:hypothetical protein
MAKGGLAVQEGERRTKAVERILLDYFDAYGEPRLRPLAATMLATKIVKACGPERPRPSR